MINSSIPVIFLAFANEKASEEGRLRLLGKERKEITAALDEMANRGECEVVVRENVSPDDIFEIFSAERYKDRIAVFHYAGHANSFGILLESHNSHTENMHFKVEGLVGFLAKQRALRLVFLNACSTKAQALSLQAKGIANVIATRQSINDAIAAELAEKFYKGLGGKKPIERALAEAGSMIVGKSHDSSFRDLSFEGMTEDLQGGGDEAGIPWDLYGTGDWWLGADIGMGVTAHLKKSSKTFMERMRQEQIKPLSIAGFEAEAASWLETEVQLNAKNMPLEQSLPNLWKMRASASWHSLMMASSGFGKTSAMFRLWELLLQDENGPVALFVPLGEFNHYPSRSQKDFIRHFIMREYFGLRYIDVSLEAQLFKLLDEVEDLSQPKVILLLDGLNEVVFDKELLIEEIQDMKKRKGLQVIVSTRMDGAFGWASDLHRMNLQPLKPQQVVAFLRQRQHAVPSNSRLLELLRVPMMLAMYVALGKEGKHGNFKPNPSTQGELMYNFYEAQLMANLERDANNASRSALLFWAFKHLLPALGYAMELEQVGNPSAFSLSRAHFKALVKEKLALFSNEETMEELIRIYPDSAMLWDAVLDEAQPMPTFAQVRQLLVDDVQVMTKVGSTYQFAHPVLRDFLSAIHILNDIQLAVAKHIVPETWHLRAFPAYLKRMIGEIESEYRSKPMFMNGAWQQRLHPSRLRLVLQLCKNLYEDGDIGYAVVNVLHIWQELREEVLVGEDLSYLNLRDINLSHTCFSLPGLPPVSFENSRMEAQNWVHDGHSLGVTALAYSPDGNWAVSVAQDFTLKEWDLQSGNCWQTLKGHTDAIESVAYLNNDTVLTASKDGNVIRWALRGAVEMEQRADETNGHKTFKGLIGGNDCHKAFFGWYGEQPIAVSSSKKNKPIAWDCNTGKVVAELPFESTAKPLAFSPTYSEALFAEAGLLRIYSLEGSYITFNIGSGLEEATAAGFRSDGWAIYVGGNDGRIGVWELQEGALTHQIDTGMGVPLRQVLPTSDGERALLLFEGIPSIYIWYLSEERIEEFGSHANGGVISMVCSPDGYRAISGSELGDIKEWDYNKGECLQTIERGMSINSLAVLLDPELSFEDALDKGELGPSDISFKIISGISYTADGTKAIWCNETGMVQAWNMEDGKFLQIFKASEEALLGLAVSPNERQLLVFGSHLALWDMSTAQGSSMLDESVIYAAFSADGMNAIAVTEAGSIQVIQHSSNRIVANVSLGTVPNTAMYAPKSHTLWAGTNEGQLLRIPVADAKAEVFASVEESISSIDMSPDQQLLAIAHGTKTSILSADKGEVVAMLEAEADMECARFSHDGKWLFTGGTDSSLLHWDWEKAKIKQELGGYSLGIINICAHASENVVLAASYDGTLREWDWETGECLGAYPALDLQIAGCNMTQFNEGNEIPDALYYLLGDYGAVLDAEEENAPQKA